MPRVIGSEASCHIRSTREGLLSSPSASEGTRTGFYTDEFTEQHFKSREEIRKANLRGCGLRDALLGPAQRAYVDQCGAILTNDDSLGPSLIADNSGQLAQFNLLAPSPAYPKVISFSNSNGKY